MKTVTGRKEVDIMYHLYGRIEGKTCSNCKHYRQGYQEQMSPSGETVRVKETCYIQRKFTSYLPVDWEDWPACGKHEV